MARDKYAGNLGTLYAVVQTSGDGTESTIQAFAMEVDAERYKKYMLGLYSNPPHLRVQPVIVMPLRNK